MLRCLLFFSSIACVHALSAQSIDFSELTTLTQSAVTNIPLNGAGVVVMKDGQAVYQQYFGNYTAQTRVPIASASKWLSSTTIARLVEQGVMRWDDPISLYFPNAPADKLNITLRQLLSHSSGIPGSDVGCLNSQSVTLAQCADTILNVPLQTPPGVCFDYGGNSFQVAGRMAEIAASRAANQTLSWDDIFIAQMVTPLQLTATDYAFTATGAGYVRVPNPRIAGGVRATARDLAQLVQMHVRVGQFNGTTFLSPATVREMQKDQSNGIRYISSPDPSSYGYGLGEWRNGLDSAGNAIETSSGGAFGTWPWIDRRAGIGGVFLVRNLLTNVEPTIRLITPAARKAVLGAEFQFSDGFQSFAAQRGGCTSGG